MRLEYEFEGTTGIKIEWRGKIFTTVENIHFDVDARWNLDVDDENYIPFPVTLSAECTTDDSDIMWGADDEESDWFPPIAYWWVRYDEVDSWAEKQNWQVGFDGMCTCTKL